MCEDYVYVIWEYWSTIWKVEHYLRHENKVNEVFIIFWGIKIYEEQ